jgi:hypothetical protein
MAFDSSVTVPMISPVVRCACAGGANDSNTPSSMALIASRRRMLFLRESCSRPLGSGPNWNKAVADVINMTERRARYASG